MLQAYQDDPHSYDNKGFLTNAPSDEVRAKIIARRIGHLEHEIQVFEEQIRRLLEEGR